MIKVTFACTSKTSGKTFFNVETFSDMKTAEIRAMALGWVIAKVESL